MVIELPWPPSVNHYWRRQGSRYFVSSEGKQYRDSVFYLSREFRGLFKLKERLSVHIQAYPPDKRRRDLDNIFKATLDCLQYAQVYEDRIKHQAQEKGRQVNTWEHCHKATRRQ